MNLGDCFATKCLRTISLYFTGNIVDTTRSTASTSSKSTPAAASPPPPDEYIPSALAHRPCDTQARRRAQQAQSSNLRSVSAGSSPQSKTAPPINPPPPPSTAIIASPLSLLASPTPECAGTCAACPAPVWRAPASTDPPPLPDRRIPNALKFSRLPYLTKVWQRYGRLEAAKTLPVPYLPYLPDVNVNTHTRAYMRGRTLARARGEVWKVWKVWNIGSGGGLQPSIPLPYLPHFGIKTPHLRLPKIAPECCYSTLPFSLAACTKSESCHCVFPPSCNPAS